MTQWYARVFARFRQFARTPCSQRSRRQNHFIMKTAAAVALIVVAQFATGQTPATIERGDFRFAYDERGISLLAHAHDPFGATLTAAAGGGRGRGAAPTAAPTLGLAVSYRAGADTGWTSFT